MRPGDLNLLLHFDALMSWRSVTRAAEELEITQPAMSAALSRLRRLFNDPVLVRMGGAWQPTHRAQDLHASFRPMLDMWRQVSLPRQSFDPKTSVRIINFFATDYVQFVVISRVIGRLAKEGPGMKFRVLAAQPQLGLGMLESNQVELIAGYFPEPGANLRMRFLFEEKVVCIVRANHPCLQRTWDLDAYLACSHVDMAAHTRYFSERIDQALLAQNRSRRVALTLSSYMACPFAVGNSDFVATVPLSVAKAVGKLAGTVTLEAPLPLPMVAVSLYWHERHHRDPAHAWVRQLIGAMF
jgi:DNA-binding transcriptional LysR family regulator